MYQCDLPYSRSKSKMRHSDWCGELIAPKWSSVLERKVALREGAARAGFQVTLEARGDAFVWEFQ